MTKLKLYFQWTDKTGRGNNASSLSIEHLREHWDLDEVCDVMDVSLEEFLEDCIPGDQYFLRTGTLTCYEGVIPDEPKEEDEKDKLNRFNNRVIELFETKYSVEDYQNKVRGTGIFYKECKRLAYIEVYGEVKRGGFRPNSGRKRIYDDKTITLSVKVPKSKENEIKEAIQELLKTYEIKYYAIHYRQ